MDILTDPCEDIVFNDADGSDKDLHRWEGVPPPLYDEKCNSWNDYIFFVDSSEGGYSIIYDDQVKNVRYSLIISTRINAYNQYDHSELIISKGKSWNGETGQQYKSDKKISVKDNTYPIKFFLNYDKDGKIDSSSKDKFVHLVDRFLKLGVFV